VVTSQVYFLASELPAGKKRLRVPALHLLYFLKTYFALPRLHYPKNLPNVGILAFHKYSLIHWSKMLSQWSKPKQTDDSHDDVGLVSRGYPCSSSIHYLKRNLWNALRYACKQCCHKNNVRWEWHVRFTLSQKQNVSFGLFWTTCTIASWACWKYWCLIFLGNSFSNASQVVLICNPQKQFIIHTTQVNISATLSNRLLRIVQPAWSHAWR